jgi:DNA polymerase-1
MPKTLYLIDGHAQIYRAYYAPFGNLSAPSGEPTRATHVFWQMLLNLVRDRRPDHLAMAMDVSDETVFRKSIYPEYKAHREPPPEDLPVQAERIIAMLETLGLPILRAPTFEADDIIATLVRRHAGPDLHVYLVSKDKDLEQLLSAHVSMYDPARDEVITPQTLLETKGWPPEQAIEAQILTGDSVDNVPGVPGIGPKTAAKLLQKYATARGVLEHAAELTPKQRENVRAFAPQLEMVRQLLTLRSDVPIELDLDRARPEGLRWSAVRPIMVELGFRRLTEQLPADAESAPARADVTVAGAGAAAEAVPHTTRPIASSPAQAAARSVGPSTSASHDLSEPREPTPAAARGAASAAAVSRVRSAMPTAAALRDPQLETPDGGVYRCVDTLEALQSLARQLQQQPVFCVDTETTDVNPIDADLVGLALAWKTGEGWYVPVRSAHGTPLALDAVRQILGPILADERRTKVGHNLKYDLIVLRQADLPVAGPLFDTMIAAFVLDPTQASLKLDTIVARLLNHTMIPITDLIGKGRDQLRMDQVPLTQITEYAAEDADYTWRLYRLFEPHLKDSDLAPLFYETEMPLVGVLTEMEYHGISIDAGFLKRMSAAMAARAEAITQQVHELAGMRFNLDSTRQLGEVLFDRLGFRVVRRTRTARSTDAETLEVLARETEHPLLTQLLEYREIQKLRGTYVDALPLSRSRRTGRIHTSFHQTGAITGRLSSSEPNLQNIPVRTEMGREIRKAFVPRTPQERLIVADYSQVELRVLAHYCEDEELIRAFEADRDIHAFVAAQIHGVPLEAVTREMRSRAKAVNFGLIYGQTAFGLAQTTGMSRTEAQAFIDQYFQRYPRIRGFIQRCISDARRDGFVRTIQGRRRPIPDIHSRNSSARAQAERLAVNTVIQGSAADLIKTAMIRLHERIQRERLPLRMLLQVHDELLFEAPASEAGALRDLVVGIMSTAMPLRVPLKVDAAVAENWLEAK